MQSVMSHSDALMRGQAIAGAGWRFVALHGGRRMVRTVSQVARSDFTVPRFATAALMIAMVGGASLYGAVLGGFLIWFIWVEAEPVGIWLMDTLTAGLGPSSSVRAHLLDAAPHARLFVMGLILLLMLRFAPAGLIPERTAGSSGAGPAAARAAAEQEPA